MVSKNRCLCQLAVTFPYRITREINRYRKMISGKDSILDFNSLLPEPGNGDYTTWRLHNWGCESNAENALIHYETKKTLVIRFETVDRMPTNFVFKVMELFPGATIFFGSTEGGHQFRHRIEREAGKPIIVLRGVGLDSVGVNGMVVARYIIGDINEAKDKYLDPEKYGIEKEIWLKLEPQFGPYADTEEISLANFRMAGWPDPLQFPEW